MKRAVHPGTGGMQLDIQACQSRLVWANQREIEERYRDVRSEAGKQMVCWLIERGSVRVEEGDGEVKAGAGEWLLLRSAAGWQRFSPRAGLISIRFELNLRGGQPLFERRQSRVLRAADHPALEQAARALVASVGRFASAGSLLLSRAGIPLALNYRIESEFLRWISAYIEVMEALEGRALLGSAMDGRVLRALTLLEERPLKEKLSEPDLARQCGLSVTQLGRLFRREVGQSPHQYAEARRMDLARHALAESRMPVKEIAFELGFSSSPHFTNWFTAREGRSPRGYRNTVGGEG